MRDIAERLDPFEWGYAPRDVFWVWDGKGEPPLVFCGKFEIDIDALTLECWRAGVPILCITGHEGPTWPL